MSVLLVSIFLFLLISVGLSLVGFRFWVQPKAALERVMGEVGLAEQSVREPEFPPPADENRQHRTRQPDRRRHPPKALVVRRHSQPARAESALRR